MDLLNQALDILARWSRQCMNLRLAVGIDTKGPVAANRVEVRHELQSRTEALDDRHRAPLCRFDARLPCTLELPRRQCLDESAQNCPAKFRVVGDTVAEIEGQREDPLAIADTVWQHMVHEMGCRLRHEPAPTRGAKATALTGKWHRVLEPARRATNTQKTVRSNAAPQEPPKFSNYEAW